MKLLFAYICFPIIPWCLWGKAAKTEIWEILAPCTKLFHIILNIYLSVWMMGLANPKTLSKSPGLDDKRSSACLQKILSLTLFYYACKNTMVFPLIVWSVSAPLHAVEFHPADVQLPVNKVQYRGQQLHYVPRQGVCASMSPASGSKTIRDVHPKISLLRFL